MYLVKNLLNFSLIRYGIVGVANTLFGLSIIFSFKLLGVDDILANFLGYCCGLLLSFKLNSRWTFMFHGDQLPTFFLFCLVIIGSYLINLAVVLVSLNIYNLDSYFSQALGIIPYTAFSYLGCRFFVFRKEE
jgi:putative flippase GtrA